MALALATKLPMPDFNAFLVSRRKTPRPKRQGKTERHLRAWLDTYDAMTPDERAEAASKAWMPPRDLVEVLLDSSLLQRDRVEMLMVVYSTLHPGHSLSWDEVGRILGIAHQVAAEYGRELIKAGRAEKRDGKFCLWPAGYNHPIVRARFPSIYRGLYPAKRQG